MADKHNGGQVAGVGPASKATFAPSVDQCYQSRWAGLGVAVAGTAYGLIKVG
jgi:hypothetical protein